MQRNDVIQVRVSQGEKERLQREAESRGVSLSEYVRRGAVQKATREAPRNPETVNPLTDPSPPLEAINPTAFTCPVPYCEFTAQSPEAKCSYHGRKVIPDERNAE